MDDFLFLLLLFLLIAVAIYMFQRMSQTRSGVPGQNTANMQGQQGSDQLMEDIKSIKTSSTSDAVAVLDDLGSTSQNYRHYCELIGKSQASGGVVAPYSKREVAYYDLRCYRIENRNGRDVETLVAHEKSIDPFWFSDNDGATKVYVDLDTFGNNVILVNATNRIEGPNSDFTKAFSDAVAKSNTQGRSGAYAMVARGVQGAHNVLAGAAHGASLAANALLGGNRMQPALATATITSSPTRTEIFVPAQALGSNIMLSDDDDHDGRRSGLYGGMGGFGMGGIPRDLDIFLGGGFSGGRVVGYGGPKFRGSGGDLLSIGLGALLGTLAASGSRPATTTGGPQQSMQNSFRGYRLIEDVVPLNNPVYALGEIYRSGTDVHIGKSISSSYPSSYFATKSEAEVLSSLK